MAEPLSLGQLGRVLLRYWLLILIGTLVGGALAFGITRFMTPVYRATAIQLVKGLPGTGAAANYEAAQYAVSRAKTYPSFVHSEQVLEGVRDDLDNADSIEQLRQDLSASNPVETPLLEISATGETPEEARDKANYAARHMARFITEIETVGNRSPITVETAVLAALPASAASPKTLVIVALGAMIGFALTTIIAMINSYVRYRRRAAFRRKQAIGWITAESPKGPAATAVAAAAAVPPQPKVGPPTAAEASALVSAQDGSPAVVATPPLAEPQLTAPAESAEESLTSPDPDLLVEGDGEPTEMVAKAGFEPDEFIFEVDPDPTTIVERPLATPRDSAVETEQNVISSVEEADDDVVSAAEDTDHDLVSAAEDTDHDISTPQDTDHDADSTPPETNHHVVNSAEETNRHLVSSAEETNHHAVNTAEQVNHHLVKLEDQDASAGLEEIELADLDSSEDTVRMPDEDDEVDVLEHSGTRKQSVPR